MGGVLGRGGSGEVKRGKDERSEKRSSRESNRNEDEQLPPLVVLKENCTQTVLSYQHDLHSKPLLINRIALWLLFVLIPYAVFVLLLAHTDFMQSLLTYAHWPTFIKDPTQLQDLTKYGFISARNIQLLKDDGVMLRGWHVAPMAGSKTHLAKLTDLAVVQNSTETDMHFDSDLARGLRPIVIYFHGNTYDRTLWYRVGVMKTLSDTLGAHVIAFDYEGFGDSEGWPNEATTYADAEAALKWVQERLAAGGALLADRQTCSLPAVSDCSSATSSEREGPKIIFYGHSLGSGVAVHVAKELALRAAQNGKPSPLSALVLDAPFSTFSDAVRAHPNGKMLRIFFGVQEYVVSRLKNKYESIDKIGDVGTRLLIIHGRRDFKIPISQARRLCDSAVSRHAARLAAGEPSHPVELLELERANHINNFQQPQYVRRLMQFLDSI